MTQAPTPGPLSGDDVNRECKGCGAFKAERDAACMFCGLAPTAPVEASGSEREHGPKCWGKTSISDEMMYCYCGSTDSPSGETREAFGGQKGDSETLRVLLDNLVIAQTLSKDIRQKATDEACSYLYDRRTTPARAEAQDEGAAGEPVVQWFKSADRTPDSGQKFVALHEDGSGAWLGFMHDGGIIDADGDDYSQTLKGVAYWAYLPTGFEFCCEGYPEDPITLPGHVCPPLYAHPSPTPAADADRVRMAVEALEVKINAPLTGPTHGAWDRGRIAGLKEALAALKSTAAKEGGAA
ncbi:MAG: hypothetical protein ACK4MI_03400 [Brevundimonas sp.]|uniref:hypothetical protein n=1 Tax=Brevundimonas sp. TaxID=1871086 RepID=UPI00391DA0A9